jgi:pSer/pThr/pTyr-binding forkhead associated (FHA) protein
MSAVRVLRGLVLGALGGLLGWCIVEPIPYLTSDEATNVDWTAIGLLAGIVGACIGAALGVAEGILAGTRSKFQRAVTLGAIVSFFGGWIGVWFGQSLYQGILNAFRITDQTPHNSFQFFLHLIARTLGWMFLGTLVGLSVGVPTQSARKMRHGLIGGMFGGALGGFSFQTLAMISQSLPLFDGPVLRLIGFTSIGAATGFFVSLVAEAFKQAWVKVLVGRNEGREHVLDKTANVIGRDELAEVPIFGDTSVARRHALILQTNGRHILRDEGAPGGTQVNGQPVTQQLLQDGDQITVGRVTMIFNEKATASPYRRPVDVARSPAVPPPLTDANTCPYCGTTRDPLSGACACTVPADSPFGQPDGAGAPDAAPFGSDAWSTSSGGSGSPRLVSLDGPYAGQQFPLRSGETTIGREPGRDVALVGDPTTSRRHAVILEQNGGFVLRDEGSANGTFINGTKVTVEHPLRPGDEVRFGSNRFRFEA